LRTKKKRRITSLISKTKSQKKNHFAPSVQQYQEQQEFTPETVEEPKYFSDIDDKLDMKQPTEEEIESYRNSTWLKEFFKGAGKDIKHFPAVLAGSTAEGFMGSLAGKMGKGMSAEGFVYSDDPQKDILEAYDRHQKVQALKKQGATTTEASRVVDRPDQDPFGIQPHRDEMNPYIRAITTGVGHMVGELPSFLFVTGAAASMFANKIGALTKLIEGGVDVGINTIKLNRLRKVAEISSMAINGAVNGLSEMDVKEIAKQGLTGGMMGSIGGIVSRIKPKVLRTMAEGLGFGTVGQLSKAIETGEIENPLEWPTDPQFISDSALGVFFGVKRIKGESISTERKAAVEKYQEESKNYKEFLDNYLGKVGWSELENRVRSGLVQKEIRKTVGEKVYGKKSEISDAAVHIYIDLPSYKGKISKLLGGLKGFDKAALERALEIKPGDPLYDVAEMTKAEYKKSGVEALDAEVISNLVENFTNRAWDLTDQPTANYVSKFLAATKHSKQRTLPSILDGLEKGMKLKVKTASENLKIYNDEIQKAIFGKKFIETGMNLEAAPGKPIFTTEKLPGYEKIDNPWFRKGIGEIRAPKQLAKELNNILGKEPSGKAIDNFAKFVATAKAVTLSTSFYHHQAFLRSFMLGGAGWAALRPFKGMKEGLAAIESLHPDIKLLVENSLTLGVKQDFPELERFKEGGKSRRVKEWIEKTPVVNILGPKFLFERMGAGLKAKAALVELNHMRKKNAKRVRKGLKPWTEAEMAREVSGLVNDDFGGENLDSLGRNKSWQKAARIFLLASDWTESNVRTMTKLIRSKRVAEKRGQWTAASDMQVQLYRRFWTRVISRGIGATVLANVLISLIPGEDDTHSVKNKVLDAVESKKAKNIFGVDITPLAELLSYEGGRRLYFPLMGHFLDPAGWIQGVVTRDLLGMPKAKGSHLTKAVLNAKDGSDWKGDVYKTVSEIIDDGIAEGYVKWGKGGGLVPGQYPAYLVDQAKGMMPIQVQQMFNYMTEESTLFESLMQSMGFGLSRGVEY